MSKEATDAGAGRGAGRQAGLFCKVGGAEGWDALLGAGGISEKPCVPLGPGPEVGGPARAGGLVCLWGDGPRVAARQAARQGWPRGAATARRLVTASLPSTSAAYCCRTNCPKPEMASTDYPAGPVGQKPGPGVGGAAASQAVWRGGPLPCGCRGLRALAGCRQRTGLLPRG